MMLKKEHIKQSLIAHNAGLKSPLGTDEDLMTQGLGTVAGRTLMRRTAREEFGDDSKPVTPLMVLNYLLDQFNIAKPVIEAATSLCQDACVGRLMQRGKFVYEVTEHIITKNGWEIYVLTAPTNTKDVKFCLTVGEGIELGDVYLPELKSSIIGRDSDLQDLLPAPGCKWVG